jgi:hypothetical protein
VPSLLHEALVMLFRNRRPVQAISRSLLAVALAGATTGVALAVAIPSLGPALRVAAIIVAVPVYFVVWMGFKLLVDELDHWLRRATRDSLWLSTDEGRRWKSGQP